MGTRSTLKIQEDGNTLVRIYRQMDGYPSGMGSDIAAALTGKRIVNGFGMDDTAETAFNGAGCLAAALIMTLKQAAGIGGIYITDPTSDDTQDYNYTVDVSNGLLRITCHEYDETEAIFDGTLDEFTEWCAQN